MAPRSILRRQIDAGRAANVTFKFASELEFYLFRHPPAESWQRQYKGLEPLSYYRSDYHILQSTKDDWIISKIRSGMNEAGAVAPLLIALSMPVATLTWFVEGGSMGSAAARVD